MKKLISLIPVQGLTKEEATKQVWEAYQHYKLVNSAVEKKLAQSNLQEKLAPENLSGENQGPKDSKNINESYLNTHPVRFIQIVGYPMPPKGYKQPPPRTRNPTSENKRIHIQYVVYK
jgi:hypothetical protein